MTTPEQQFREILQPMLRDELMKSWNEGVNIGLNIGLKMARSMAESLRNNIASRHGCEDTIATLAGFMSALDEAATQTGQDTTTRGAAE